MKCLRSPITCIKLLLALLLSGPLTSVATTRVVDIRPRIVCSSAAVRLADLAVYPEQLSTEERELVVTEGGNWEQGQRVSLRSIAYLLQRFDGLRDLHLRGPDYLTVVRLAGPEQVDRIRTALVSALSSELPWRDWELDVQLTNADNLQIAHAGGVALVEVVSLDRRAVLGHLDVEIAVSDADGSRRRLLRLAPLVRRRSTAIVVVERCPAGTLLAEEHLAEQEVWIDHRRDSSVETMSACIGREVRRHLAAGEIVSAGDLMAPRCAARGDQVWVTSLNGALTVRLVAIAQQPGREGDQIQLRNQSSDKLFRATLTGPRLARLQIGP